MFIFAYFLSSHVPKDSIFFFFCQHEPLITDLPDGACTMVMNTFNKREFDEI